MYIGHPLPDSLVTVCRPALKCVLQWFPTWSLWRWSCCSINNPHHLKKKNHKNSALARDKAAYSKLCEGWHIRVWGQILFFEQNFIGTQPHPFMCRLSIAAPTLQQCDWVTEVETVLLTSQKYLLSGPLQKKSANLRNKAWPSTSHSAVWRINWWGPFPTPHIDRELNFLA